MGTITENVWAFHSPGGLEFGVVNPTPVASAATMPKPTALVTTVSGAAAISLLTIPWPGFTGFIILIPSGAFTMVTTGTGDGATTFPIGVAVTAVVGKALIMVFDGAKWWPSNVN